MTFLVRSRAVSLVLLVAFGAAEATLRRKATEDSLSFTNVNVAEATETNGSDLEAQQQVPADFGEDSIGILEENDNPAFLPPLDNLDPAEEDQQQQQQLEQMAHDYEEAMMRAQEYENQARHEQELAAERLVEDATLDAQTQATIATDRATVLLEEVHAMEVELEQQHEIDNLQAFAEDRRRHLLETIQSSGKTQATLHGITYEVEE